jgi:hypothetical protein
MKYVATCDSILKTGLISFIIRSEVKLNGCVGKWTLVTGSDIERKIFQVPANLKPVTVLRR